MFVTGLVLAAGPSRRLCRPKQLLPYRGATKLLRSSRYPTAEVAADGPVPIDVGTWDDHRALPARSGDGAAP